MRNTSSRTSPSSEKCYDCWTTKKYYRYTHKRDDSYYAFLVVYLVSMRITEILSDVYAVSTRLVYIHRLFCNRMYFPRQTKIIFAFIYDELHDCRTRLFIKFLRLVPYLSTTGGKPRVTTWLKIIITPHHCLIPPILLEMLNDCPLIGEYANCALPTQCTYAFVYAECWTCRKPFVGCRFVDEHKEFSGSNLDGVVADRFRTCHINLFSSPAHSSDLLTRFMGF